MKNIKDQREINLGVPEEFSYIENLKYLSRNSNECMFTIKDQMIYKAISLKEETLIIEIRPDDENGIIIRILGGITLPNKKIQAKVAAYVREWFDLDRDLRPFYALAKTDPLLGRAVENSYGLRIIGIDDLFEALCWGILGQQINLTFAYTLKRRFVENYGRRLEHDGMSYWIFPAPEEIAALSVDDLKHLQITGKKSEYLIGVAQLLAEGSLTKDMLLETESIKAAEKILVNIRGIGPWTANYVLMRCLRFPSAFPIDDVGLHNAIKLLLGKEKKPSKEEIIKFSAIWTNWESYATFYLWRFLY